MNNRSEQAALRSKLFASLVGKQGAVVLPGRYGGDYNNDHLAYVENGDTLTLILGLKVLEEEGGVHLDNASLGPHTQYTKPWFMALIGSLAQDPETKSIAVRIEKSLRDDMLVGAIICLDQATQQVSMFKVEI